jgi:hypothetical protein
MSLLVLFLLATQLFLTLPNLQFPLRSLSLIKFSYAVITSAIFILIYLLRNVDPGFIVVDETNRVPSSNPEIKAMLAKQPTAFTAPRRKVMKNKLNGQILDVQDVLSNDEITPRPATSYMLGLPVVDTTSSGMSEEAAPLIGSSDGSNTIINYEEYCRNCEIFRPDRAGHCARCNFCCVRFDHHCGMLGACIGLYNYRFFLLLLVVSALGTGIATFANFSYLLQLSPFDWSDHRAVRAYLYVLLFFGVLYIGMVFLFFIFHCYLILNNTTTREKLRKNRNISGLSPEKGKLSSLNLNWPYISQILRDFWSEVLISRWSWLNDSHRRHKAGAQHMKAGENGQNSVKSVQWSSEKEVFLHSAGDYGGEITETESSELSIITPSSKRHYIDNNSGGGKNGVEVSASPTASPMGGSPSVSIDLAGLGEQNKAR